MLRTRRAMTSISACVLLLASSYQTVKATNTLTPASAGLHEPAFVYAQQAEPPCLPGRRLDRGQLVCYPLNQFRTAAAGLPFAAADPVQVLRRVTHLPATVVVAQRIGFPPSNGAAFPLGPPESITAYFGSFHSTWSLTTPPQPTPTFVRITYYQQSFTGHARLWQFSSGHQWVFTADVSRQSMSIEVNSDGLEEAVGAIGRALAAAERRATLPPAAPLKVYVSPPSVLHVDRPATYWVLVAPRWGTRPQNAGFDFDFVLGGSWGRPTTQTPDGSQACGGDNIAGQPTRRRGRWVFNWGDCRELGLTAVPRGTREHSLTIYGYTVPLTSSGRLDLRHEKPEPGSGHEWRGTVSPRN
jgi:hypothetical protein